MVSLLLCRVVRRRLAGRSASGLDGDDKIAGPSMPIEAHKPAVAACCGHGWRCVMEATDRVGGGRHHHPKCRARKTRGARCAGECGWRVVSPSIKAGPDTWPA